MGALVSRALLDALVDPKFQAELPDGVRDQVAHLVAQTADQGDYGVITLGYTAAAVREAAKRLKSTPRVSKRLARELPDIARLPGY